MARHPNIETCIFCMEFPCTCPGVAKKASPRKKKEAAPSSAKSESATDQQQSSSSQDALSVPSATESPSLDIKAAMKAASGSAPSQADLQTNARWIPRDEYDAEYRAQRDNPELDQAISNLEPILHPVEKRAYSDILERPDLRARRWRDRNADREES